MSPTYQSSSAPGSPPPLDEHYIIVGAGPVGLLAAILLAKERKAKVDVYEMRDSIPSNPQESYPIGLNPRGVRAMDRANRDIALAIRNQCFMVDGWKILAGKRLVAETSSGLVIGATRSLANQALLDEVEKNYRGTIQVHWSHRLLSMDHMDRQLVFEHRGQEVPVDGSASRVLAADGVRSQVRRLAQEKYPDLRVQATPWGVKFRLLFSRPGAKAPGLDPRFHYVQSGIYISVIHSEIWVIAIGIRDAMSDELRELLESTESTDANRAALRRFVTQAAPLAVPFLTEDDISKYFSRRSFTGSIIKLNKLHIGEWICFLGDAAHSVIPPTGEGFNSGAEDCEVLLEALNKSNTNAFRVYNDLRLPDVHALHDLAYDINKGSFSGPAPERIARLITTILVSLLKKVRFYRYTYEELTFGSESSPPRPYRDIINMWKWQRGLLLLMSRCIVWPIYIVTQVVMAPISVPLGILRFLGKKMM